MVGRPAVSRSRGGSRRGRRPSTSVESRRRAPTVEQPRRGPLVARVLAVGLLTIGIGLGALSLGGSSAEPGATLRTSRAAAPEGGTSPSSSTTSTSAPYRDEPPPPSSPAALGLCEARLAQYAGPVNPLRVSLVAAYPSTAADVAFDEELRRGPGHRSKFRDRPPAEFEAVCWFDADAFGSVPGRDKGAARPFDRLVEVVRPDGSPVFHRAGHKDTMPVVALRRPAAR